MIKPGSLCRMWVFIRGGEKPKSILSEEIYMFVGTKTSSPNKITRHLYTFLNQEGKLETFVSYSIAPQEWLRAGFEEEETKEP